MTDTPDPRGTSSGTLLPYPDPSSLVRDHPTDHQQLVNRLDALDRYRQQVAAIAYTNSPGISKDVAVGALLPIPLNFPTLCTIVLHVYMGYSSFTGGNYWYEAFTASITDPRGYGWTVATPKIAAPPALQWAIMPSLVVPGIPVAANGRPDLTLRTWSDGGVSSYNFQGRAVFLSAWSG